jgi:predicted acyltransferase
MMAKKGAVASPAGRMGSIDAVRGFDMFWIIGGGDIVRELLNLIFNPMPKWLEVHFTHTKWSGFYGWDLIMPLFLFIVGASLPFAMSQRFVQQAGRRRTYLRIARRVIILWILGILVQGNLLAFDLSKLHLFSNTLQAIACGYVVAAVLLMNVRIVWQGAACAALLAGYWLLMMFVPVPGHGAPMLTEHVNLAMYVDETILGRFRDGSTYTWIPSGMTFSATVLLGVMSGHILKSSLKPSKKFLSLAGAGVLCLAAGLVWGLWFPIIKHIWSSSFTLFAAGLSFLLLALFYGLIDVIGFRKWAFFFIVIGTNAIFVYVLTELVNPPIGKFLEVVAKNHGIAVAAPIALGSFALLWLILYGMWRKKIFIKV